jgi:hypothetical protein
MCAAIQKAIPIPNLEGFKSTLLDRMDDLADEFAINTFIMPVGLFLVLDDKNGGDPIAHELIRRFGLLNFESRNVIDFYFLGWRCPEGTDHISFDLGSFENFRDFLSEFHIKEFGGNADLILVDAAREADGNAVLNFSEAIRIDLSVGASNKDFPSLGSFLQAIIQTAGEIKRDAENPGRGVTYSISDRLGLAVAKQSVLDWFFGKYGKIIGASKLQRIAVRNLGAPVRIFHTGMVQSVEG